MSKENFKNQELNLISLYLCSLSVFRNLLEDDIFKYLQKLINYIACEPSKSINEAVNLYNSFYFSLIQFDATPSLNGYILDKILFDENSFSSTAETQKFTHIGVELRNAAKNDLTHLHKISNVSSAFIKSCLIKNLSLTDFEVEFVNKLPVWEVSEEFKSNLFDKTNTTANLKKLFLSDTNWGDCLEPLANFYFENGSGIFARFNALIWEGSGDNACLRGIENPDPILLSDLIEYKLERSEVISNTLKFLNNLPANNVLLYGDRGTGKSSTVKAILNEYHTKGLRVIEVPKKSLIDFPDIIRSLRNKKHKYIIFVDDLAFEDNEESYTALKAVLEGGFESKPENVIIYATSNRRHLIKEKFSDRKGLFSGDHDDEIRAADSIQEKLSLADRFGITVVFSSPDKQRYLEIVEGIAAKRGLKYDKDYLHKEAMKWELWYNGRSPRTAKQFVDWLEGENNKNTI